MARSALDPAREGFTVLSALSDFSEEQLLTLLRSRPDLASPPPRDLPALAARVSHWSSISDAVATLNLPSKQLLDGLCLLPQPTTVDTLSELLATDLDPVALEAALTRLANLALIFRDGQALRLHPHIISHPYPAGLGPPLSALVATVQKGALDAIARRYGAKPGAIKAETIATLTRILRDPNRLAEALVDAPTGTAPLVANLAGHGFATVPSGTYNIRPQTPLGWLADRGLIFTTDWETVVMPREIALAFRGGRPFPDFSLAPPTIRWQPVDAEAVERSSTEQALRVVADVVTVLDGWDDAPPKLLKAGGIGVRDLRRIAATVGRSGPETARLIELAGIAGLAGWDDESAAARPCPAYDRWLELPVAERWVALVTSWLAADLHISLAGATGSNAKPIPPLIPPFSQYPARHRRRLVLAALLEGEPGQSADGDSLAARVVWDAPTIWATGPARPPTLVDWTLGEAEMLGLCAGGALSRLGREIVTGQVDRAQATLAARAPKVTSQFVIQADLTAVATGPLAIPVRTDLELMADLESSGAATVYRFSEASVRRAYDAGWSSEAIQGFLEARASRGVPQPLTYLVDDVGRRYGQARVGAAAAYIRSDEPSLLAEILVARKAAKLDLRQLAPTVLVSTADPDVVMATLRASGFVPAEEGTSGALVIRRREVARATEAHGPLTARSFDLEAGRMARDRAAELSRMLAHPGTGTGFSPGIIARSAAQQDELQVVVERLRATAVSAGSDQGPRRGGAPPAGVPHANGSGRVPLPFSELEILDGGQDRPPGIARSGPAIVELFEEALKQGWFLELEYLDGRGQIQFLTAVVYRLDSAQVVVGTLPTGNTRILTFTRIAWARVLSEVEEQFYE